MELSLQSLTLKRSVCTVRSQTKKSPFIIHVRCDSSLELSPKGFMVLNKHEGGAYNMKKFCFFLLKAKLKRSQLFTSDCQTTSIQTGKQLHISVFPKQTNKKKWRGKLGAQELPSYSSQSLLFRPGEIVPEPPIFSDLNPQMQITRSPVMLSP